jgi:hypothetical protein
MARFLFAAAMHGLSTKLLFGEALLGFTLPPSNNHLVGAFVS